MSAVEVDDATRDVARQVGHLWWFYLVLGILWTWFGMVILSYRPGTVVALAVLAGCAFIASAITMFITAYRVTSWRWMWLAGGAVGLVAGIVCFIHPNNSIYVISVVVSWFLLIGGIVRIIGALLEPKYDWWWLGLVVGAIMLVLGIWAIGTPVRQVLLLVNIVGIYMIFFGIAEVFSAFSLRSIAKQVGK
jgi:uncharacterized membrane protein HdeD (DUF308 family)